MTTEAEQFRRDIIVLFARVCLLALLGWHLLGHLQPRTVMVGILSDLLAGYAVIFTDEQLQDAFGKPGSRLN